MEEVVSYFDKVKRYFWFTPAELRSFIISVLVLGFIISFTEWGEGAFDFSVGFMNYFIAVLIVGVSVFVHLAGQKLWALGTGFRHEFQMWGIGLGIAVVLAFVTNGKFWMMVPGGFIIHHLAGHRLGWFRYGLNYWALGLVALAGPIATVFLMVIVKAFGFFIPAQIVYKILTFNLLYNVFSMLPIPPLDGSKIMFGARMLYAFYFPYVIAASLMLWSNIPALLSIIGSLLIGALIWLLYYIFFEKDVWY